MTANSSGRAKGAWRLVLVALGALLAAATFSGRAASAGINVWTSHGPDGGDVWRLVALAASPTRLLAGTTSAASGNLGSIWVSADAGASWRRSAALGEFQQVYALVPDPSNPSVAYATTRAGILKTQDGGEHWVSLGGMELGVMAIAPSKPTTIYGNYNQTLVKSEDGAATWRWIASGLPTGTSVGPVIVQPDSERTVYAGTTGNGVFKSTDGGETWAAASSGLPSTAQDRVTHLTFDFHTPAGILAVVESSINGAALYRSTDGGTSWINLPLPIAVEYISKVAVSQRDPGLIYLAAHRTVLKSTDDGGQWSTPEIQSPIDTWIRALAVDPNDTEALYAGIAVGAGVLRSGDGGATWTPSGRGIAAASVQALAAGPAPDNTLHALVQTTRNFAELFTSEDRGASWPTLGEIPLCGFPEAIVVDPSNPEILYAGGVSGPLRSTDSGRSWASIPEGFDRVVRWVHSLAIDPSNPRILYAGSVRLHDSGRWWGELVYRTNDGGATWQVASSGMPTSTATRVTALAVDPRRTWVVYAGGAQLWRSVDRGHHWVSLSTAGGPLAVSAIVVDPRNSDRVLCAARGAAGGGAVVRTTDGGSSWSESFPPGGAEALVLDPMDTDIVFVGGHGGISMSLDGGTTWAPINGGLAVARVTALVVDGTGTVLHAATDGGGVFDLELSNATPGLALAPDAITMPAGACAEVVATIDPP